MTWVIASLLAQVAILQPPSTNHPALDTVLYLLSGLLGMLGLREGTYWVGKLKTKRVESDIDVKIEELVKTQREHVHATTEVINALSVLQEEIRAMHVKLGEIQGRMSAP